MTTVRVQTGTVEPVEVYATDRSGDPITGKTDLFVRVRRQSDGLYLDFDDDTFKASGWTERDRSLTEIDATLAPGLYELPGGIDTGAFTNATDDDNLVIISLQTPGTDAVLPAPGEMKVGQYVDLVKQTHQKHFNRREIDFPGSKEVLYADDGLTPLGEQPLQDGGGNPVVVLPGAPAKIGSFT